MYVPSNQMCAQGIEAGKFLRFHLSATVAREQRTIDEIEAITMAVAVIIFRKCKGQQHRGRIIMIARPKFTWRGLALPFGCITFIKLLAYR
jgi:hypothetical protein